ncbi:hypothetical protein GCM10010136_05850 [Limoniibacter endophyticus]|uniref:N-formylglutamate amidohydrolase n=2 Tax=Limoniibacter endophyticus TaxID=1565040 RepID=A0A8J3GH35_9HYPH|nr:hypothetical protein GCM10010136_05850 [Limoniibacter endophyticus]
MFNEPVPPFANIRSMRVASGLGTVPRLVGEGQDIYHTRLPLSEALDRIDTIYRPYHETLKTLLSEARTLHGTAVLIDCHSMPTTIKSGDNAPKPDFIIGDRFGASCSAALREHAIALLSSLGYVVAYNRPYAGGFITEHYGRPSKAYHALQIEMSRGLYLNETTFEKTADFTRLERDLAWFVRELVSLPLDYLDGLPLAAE